MNNTPTNKYSEIVEQCKQALTVIILSADIIGTRKDLSPEDEKCLKEIRGQALRIDRELNKGGDKIEQEREEIKGFLSEIRTQNNAIGQGLAGIIRTVATIKASQIGNDIMISDLQERIK